MSHFNIFSFSFGLIKYSDKIHNRCKSLILSNGHEVLQSNHKSTFFRVVIPCCCRRSDTIYLALEDYSPILNNMRWSLNYSLVVYKLVQLVLNSYYYCRLSNASLFWYEMQSVQVYKQG